MEIDHVNATREIISNYLANRPERETTIEPPAQTENNRAGEAYRVELSEEAQEQREFAEERREAARLEEAQNSTYNASAKIGG